MKKKLIAGNWKMNGSLAANESLLKALLAGVGQPACQVAVCVPAVRRSADLHWCDDEYDGDFTHDGAI